MPVCFLLFLTHFLQLTAGCQLKDDKSTQDMTAYTGSSALLPCSCTDLNTKPEELRWIFYKGSYSEEIYPTKETNRYTHRVKLVNSESSGNVSLLISGLNEEDEGPYRCEIKRDRYKDIKLTVKGCTELNSQEEVIGYIGQSVVLPCTCTELQAKPKKLNWIFIKNSVSKEIYIKDKTTLHTDRVQLVNSTSAGNLSLLISELNKEDEGPYRCEISKNIYKDVHLKLTASPSSEPSAPTTKTNDNDMTHPTTTQKGVHSPSSIAGAAAAAGVLILFVALSVVIYYRYRGKKQRQTGGGEGQTGQRTLPETQTDVQCSAITLEPMDDVINTQNVSEVLYSAINPKTKCKKAPKQDDVTYCTVSHFNGTSPAPAVIKCEETEYASIKMN